MDLLKVLLGNDSTNIQQPNSVFYAVSAATAAPECFHKHVSTIEYEMFSVWSVRRLYNEWQLSSQPVLV
jgi:hypothetical protein